MFTGIIKDIGKIIKLDNNKSDLNIEVKTNLILSDISIGDSICCDGICLTVISLSKNTFNAELSKETLSVTTSSNWEKGKKINLEKSLLLGEQIGGHLVSGHVDGLGFLKKKQVIKGSVKLDFLVSKVLKKYISKKGSIAINGVSLTVNTVNKNLFSVNIISHTLNNTTISLLNINDEVNIEVDTIARYAVNAAESYIKEK
ncbi:MAG: riboflavin synthase [Pelagibacterales bacterium]|nr:riboflavin synthase [Pelagibacterales bacterium]PPR15263.1 MAG: Riboflavin synthase [Alphaproteobacteria bacterium MarineAlpha9_Bin3]